MKRKSIIRRIFDYIRSIFLNGLLTILPIILTAGLFTYTFKFFKNLLEPIQKLEPEYLKKIPHSEFILVLLFVIITGAIFKTFFLRRLLHNIESTFFKVPLMQPVYFGIKQLVQAFTTQDKVTFKRVVLVQFPRKDIYSIGFLTSTLPKNLSPDTQKTFYSIFIPTTPNPTSGFLIVVPEQDIIDTDLTRQEAMSLIISGGIVQPERYNTSTTTS